MLLSDSHRRALDSKSTQMQGSSSKSIGQEAQSSLLFFSTDTPHRANGDITSLKYNGVEYQSTTKMTAINSGLGTSTVTGETINGMIKITVKAGSLPLTHYFVIRPKEATIYMGTYITGEIDPGELRWLARLRKSELATGVHGNVGDTTGCTAFEGKDTFKCSNGETRCKMYTSDRFIDDIVHGVSGPVRYPVLSIIKIHTNLYQKASLWMIMPGTAYETSASGPFMRDINSQSGDTDQELYWYMNSGHLRTEPWRFGLQGPYAMTFTQVSHLIPHPP